MAVGWITRLYLAGLVAALPVTPPAVAEAGAELPGVQRMLDTLTWDAQFPRALVHR